MCSRCYRLVTATTKATSRASIATAVSTGTSFLGSAGGPPGEWRCLLNDRPRRLTEPDRVFDSCGLMLGMSWPSRGSVLPWKGSSALVDPLYRLRRGVVN
jgi:hypothetical protein